MSAHFRFAVALTVLATAAPLALAQTPGTLDTTFAQVGYSSYPILDGRAEAVAVQSDHSVITAGYNNAGGWLICRLTPSGVVDTGFGTNGQVVLFSSNMWAFDVAVDASDRILVVGQGGTPGAAQFTVVRLNPGGSLDASFGSGGIVMTQFGREPGRAFAVAVDPVGRIVVAGLTYSRRGYECFVVVRYESDGSLDTTFGPPGRKITDPHDGYLIFDPDPLRSESVNFGAIALQANGGIALGGYADFGTVGNAVPDTGWAVVRVLPDGVGVDPAFGAGGMVHATSYGPFTNIALTGIGVQSDDRIVATGRANDSSYDYDALAVRYTASGAVDPTFGTSGLATTGLWGNPNGRDLVVQDDDKLAVCINNYDGYAHAFRWMADGTPDTTFGLAANGMSEGAGAFGEAYLWTIAEDDLGAIYIAGNGDGVFVGKLHEGAGQPPTIPLAPTALVTTAVSVSQIDLSWTDNADNEGGFRVERSLNGVNWTPVALRPPNATAWNDGGLASETLYYHRVQAYNAAGDSAWSNIASVTTLAAGPVEDVADDEFAIAGTVVGDHIDTWLEDDVYEAITECESGGKPANRYSYLEHSWVFEVTGGSEVTFYVSAWHTPNLEGDDFVFAYSLDGVSFTDMVTVTKTADDDFYQTFTLPSWVSGTVYVTVYDVDDTEGHRTLDTIYVDHMFIESRQ